MRSKKKQEESKRKDKKDEKKAKQGANAQEIVPRGKKNKIKKMKQKYGDQDEEERDMRMAMLGAKQVTGFDLKKHQDK